VSTTFQPGTLPLRFANTTIISTTNADNAQHLVLNFVDLPLLILTIAPQGAFVVTLIRSSFAVLTLTGQAPAGGVFSSDGLPTSLVYFLNLQPLLIAGPEASSSSDILTMACGYVEAFPSVILSAGSIALNISVTAASAECTQAGAGVIPTPLPVLVMSTTSFWFPWTISAFLFVVLIAMLLRWIMKPRF
jgi:hypothetical protein